MAEQIITKTCIKCKQIKPLSEFYTDTRRRDGFAYYCKLCISNAVRKYRGTQKGKAVAKAVNKRYHQSKKGKAAVKRYEQTEKGKARIKRYRQSEKGKATAKRYKVIHQEKIQAVVAVNHAIELCKLQKASNFSCHYCPEQAEQYHHHLGYEPEHWLDVIPVCIKCHNILRSQTPILAPAVG